MAKKNNNKISKNSKEDFITKAIKKQFSIKAGKQANKTLYVRKPIKVKYFKSVIEPVYFETKFKFVKTGKKSYITGEIISKKGAPVRVRPDED